MWSCSFRKVPMDIRYLVLIKTRKKKKKENRGSIYCDPLTCGSLNLSTIFCRFLIDIVPSRRTYWYLWKGKKNSYFWRLICNYSLEYLFLFVLCTLFVLLIDVYNKQTKNNNEKSKNDRDLTLFRINKTTLSDIRFQYFFLLLLFFSPVFQSSAIWFWTLLRIKRIKKVERWWEVRKDCSTILRDWPKDCSYLKNIKRILIAGDKRSPQS